MSEVLYRKYRPRVFADLVGQNIVKTILKNAISSGRISHAYLFTGPRGVGKTSAARILAKAVNCLHPKGGEPDDECENCNLISSGSFLDLIEIDAASYTGVDNIREIIEHVKFAPSRGKYKVFIVDEVHMLSKAAFNALLKTLEEPPQHAIFILATTELHKVPATIVSRTQRFDFRAISQAETVEVTKKILADRRIELSEEILRLIAQAASGSLRDALSILDQVLSYSEGQALTLEMVEDILGLTRMEIVQKFIADLIAGDSLHGAETIRRLAYEGKDLVQFTRNLLEYLRLLLLVKFGSSKASAFGLEKEAADHLERQAGSISFKALLMIIKLMLEAHRETKISPVPELPLLSAVLSFANPQGNQPQPPPPGKEEPQSEAARASKPAEQPKAEGGALNIGIILDKWSEVLSKVKEYNHSLISSLRLGRIAEMNGNEIIFAFPYSFHKDTILAMKNRIILEQVFEEIFGSKLRVSARLEKEDAPKAPVSKPEEDPAPGIVDHSAGANSGLIDEAMRILGTMGE